MVKNRKNTLDGVRNILTIDEIDTIKINGKNYIKNQRFLDTAELSKIMSKVLNYEYSVNDMNNPKMINIVVKLFIML